MFACSQVPFESSPELLNTGHPLVEVAHATRRVIILYAVLSHAAQALLRHRLVVSALGLYVVDLHILVVNLAAAIGAMPVALLIDRLADILVHLTFDFSIVSIVCQVIHTSVGMPNTFSSCAAYAVFISLLPVHSALNVGGDIFASFAA